MRFVRVGAKELVQVRASHVLAVDPRVLSSGAQLADEPAETEERGKVAIVSAIGPMAQRAVRDLCGYVDGYDALTARFTAALASQDVGAVVLRVDSPGGDVAGLEEAIGRMVEARRAAGKPVYAYVDELAASAAYWLSASLADHGVFLPGAGLVGSIGAIGTLVDATKAAEQDGLKVTLVRDPAGKAEAHPYGPDQELAQERLGAMVTAASGRFAAAIASLRGLKVQTVRELNAALLQGEAAVEAGLADGVRSLEDVVSMATAEVRRRKSMKNTRAKLGLSESATDEEVEHALETEVADARAARAAREKLGAGSNAEAIERLDALLASHASAEQERARAKAAAEAREATERRGLVAELVKLGFETPATAWADPLAQPEALQPRGHLAGMVLEDLRARVATFKAAPKALLSVNTEGEAPATVGVTPEELAELKARGIDPARYTAIKQEMQQKRAASARGETR